MAGEVGPPCAVSTMSCGGCGPADGVDRLGDCECMLGD